MNRVKKVCLCSEVKEETNRPNYVVREIFKQLVEKIRVQSLVPKGAEDEFLDDFTRIMSQECRKKDTPIIYM